MGGARVGVRVGFRVDAVEQDAFEQAKRCII